VWWNDADDRGSGRAPAVTADLELRGRVVVLVPVAGDHVGELRRIVGTPEVRGRWGDQEVRDPDWPFDDPSATPFTILVDGAVRGLVQYGEETGPMYRYASIDIFLDPAVHGRGHGRDALGTLARYLVDERGHHRLTIDPAADNDRAIRCYEAVGFRRVGIMRSYEHDVDGPGWHDGLLMDLLAGELE
jgi:RimJ/RimL family protein N-acetyltransferase